MDSLYEFPREDYSISILKPQTGLDHFWIKAFNPLEHMAEEKAAAAPKAATENKPEQKKKDENARQPSALKRDIQSEKRHLRNRGYRSSVLTAVRHLETSIVQKEAPEIVRAKLNAVYSLMDAGVKKGVYKSNKAARTKSRMAARVKAL